MEYLQMEKEIINMIEDTYKSQQFLLISDMNWISKCIRKNRMMFFPINKNGCQGNCLNLEWQINIVKIWFKLKNLRFAFGS